jgi:hypothetical protein
MHTRTHTRTRIARHAGALARYHKMKIGEINSAIKSLWASAYKGTDIEEIAIVSDE